MILTPIYVFRRRDKLISAHRHEKGNWFRHSFFHIHKEDENKEK